MKKASISELNDLFDEKLKLFEIINNINIGKDTQNNIKRDIEKNLN